MSRVLLTGASGFLGVHTLRRLLEDGHTVRTAACANVADHSATTQELGVQARPPEESVRDTVRWLVSAGHLKAKHAGRALA